MSQQNIHYRGTSGAGYYQSPQQQPPPQGNSVSQYPPQPAAYRGQPGTQPYTRQSGGPQPQRPRPQIPTPQNRQLPQVAHGGHARQHVNHFGPAQGTPPPHGQHLQPSGYRPHGVALHGNTSWFNRQQGRCSCSTGALLFFFVYTTIIVVGTRLYGDVICEDDIRTTEKLLEACSQHALSLPTGGLDTSGTATQPSEKMSLQDIESKQQQLERHKQMLEDYKLQLTEREHRLREDEEEVREMKRKYEKLQRDEEQGGGLLQTSESDGRMLVIITPTYIRPHQAPHITMMANTIRSVPPPLLWLLVEEVAAVGGRVEYEPTPVTRELIQRVANGINYHLLAQPQASELENPNGHRGVSQRNRGLEYVIDEGIMDAAIYFGDDDNQYDLRLFSEIRKVKRVGVFPVGMVEPDKKMKPDLSGLETPICESGKVVGWVTGFSGGGARIIKSDMGGFAFNSDLLFRDDKTPVKFSMESDKGMLETDIILQLLGNVQNTDEVLAELETLANDCTDVLVWHNDGKSEPKGLSMQFPYNWRLKQPLTKCRATQERFDPYEPGCV